VAGELIAVTGPLGGSAAGLRVLQAPPPAELNAREREIAQRLVERHVRPRPRVDAGGFAVRAGLRCGMDISDGLVQDLGHICRASGVDAELRIDDLPLEDGLTALFSQDARALAATGGEDYELLLVGGEGVLRIAGNALRKHVGMPNVQQLTIVGRITGAGAGRVRVIDGEGAEVALPSPGWDHLAPGGRP
jgi:thiamine-monophosphate kinase